MTGRLGSAGGDRGTPQDHPPPGHRALTGHVCTPVLPPWLHWRPTCVAPTLGGGGQRSWPRGMTPGPGAPSWGGGGTGAGLCALGGAYWPLATRNGGGGACLSPGGRGGLCHMPMSVGRKRDSAVLGNAGPSQAPASVPRLPIAAAPPAWRRPPTAKRGGREPPSQRPGRSGVEGKPPPPSPSPTRTGPRAPGPNAPTAPPPPSPTHLQHQRFVVQRALHPQGGQVRRVLCKGVSRQPHGLRHERRR